MKMRWQAWLPLMIFLCLAAALFVGLQRDPSEIPSALIGKPAPEFTLPALNASTRGFSDSDLRQGKVTLVNVFASWCTPCAQEQPLLMELARNPGIELLGIAYKDKAARTQAYLDRLGNPYARVGDDPDGRIGIEWGVYGVPETYVVDGRGRIVDKHVGPLTAESLKEEILPKIRAAEAKS